MRSFFDEDCGTDPLYEIYRDDQFSWGEESAREFIERAWGECHLHCDPDLPSQAKQHFLARFWELYLAYFLKSSGVQLQKRSRTDGPDFRLKDHPVWIEAVTVSAGAGADALETEPEGRATSVPDREIQLRLRSAIEAKAQKFRHYIERGVVRPDEVSVIAVNASAVPSARTEALLPRIVRVLFPFGHLTAHLDLRTMAIARTSYSFEDRVEKRSGAVVSTAIFLDPTYSHIGAVLYSASDPINRPDQLGVDFALVHNPLASQPLPKGILKTGSEYWKDGEKLVIATATGRGAPLEIGGLDS